jgi:hypothetical protein
VLEDVLEGWEGEERAKHVYGVVLTATAEGELAVDAAATAALRHELAARARAKEEAR